jgi:hypothetical protein
MCFARPVPFLAVRQILFVTWDTRTCGRRQLLKHALPRAHTHNTTHTKASERCACTCERTRKSYSYHTLAHTSTHTGGTRALTSTHARTRTRTHETRYLRAAKPLQQLDTLVVLACKNDSNTVALTFRRREARWVAAAEEKMSSPEVPTDTTSYPRQPHDKVAPTCHVKLGKLACRHTESVYQRGGRLQVRKDEQFTGFRR